MPPSPHARTYKFARRKWVSPPVPAGDVPLFPTKILNALIHSALASGCHEYEAVDRGLATIFALDLLFEGDPKLDAQGRIEVRFFCHQLLVNGLEGEVAVARAYETYRRLRVRIAEIGREIPSLQLGKMKRPALTKSGKPRRRRGDRTRENAPPIEEPAPGDDFHLP